MCTWSAYTGKQPAAEILWHSLRAVEGIWGGFFTGIVTQNDNEFHCQKTIGCTDVWQQKYNLADLKGTSGLAHSRTNSGGDSRWGHPFAGTNGKIHLISQGSYGVFADNNATFEKVGNMLLNEGKTFSSADFDSPRRYPVLADGSQVHASDISAQAVEYYYEMYNDPVKALREAFKQLPEEAASLVLFKDKPGIIGFVNTNQRMVYRFLEDGAMLSISTLGLGSFYGTEIPGNSVGYITHNSLVMEKLDDRYQVSPEIPSGMREACLEFIRNNPGCLVPNYVDQVLRKILPPTKLCYRTVSAYRILESLISEKQVVLKESIEKSQSDTPGRVFRIFPA